MEIVIDPEFRDLIPPLPYEEFTELEQAIINDGCRDALVVWFNDETLRPVLIDGHHRYQICKKHDVRFETVEKEFDSREDVKIWMIRNQFGRRNLTPYVKTTLALQLEPLLAAKAKQNQVARKGEQAGTSCQKSDNLITPIDTKKEVAKVAGVSHDTVAKVKLINSNQDLINREIIDDLRSNRRSINEVANIIKETKAASINLVQKPVIEEPKQTQPEPAKSVLTEDQARRLTLAMDGVTQIANISNDRVLIDLATQKGIYEKIDRNTVWGNPFVLGDDGDRETVIENYRDYLTKKPSLQRQSQNLRGKILGCWCYPQNCHGHVLIEEFKL